jgi:Lrp/AsnC family transcriptional regulator, leucine-responsive regulatory protein
MQAPDTDCDAVALLRSDQLRALDDRDCFRSLDAILGEGALSFLTISECARACNWVDMPKPRTKLEQDALPPGLDDFDLEILSILAADGRINWRALAERIGLSHTPTLRRVRALEKAGYICGYHAQIDERHVGRGISVFILVSLDSQTQEALALFESTITAVPDVMSCFMMTGSWDYILRVAVCDLDSFQSFISSTLTRIPHVKRVSSGVAVKPVVQRVAPALRSSLPSRHGRTARR